MIQKEEDSSNKICPGTRENKIVPVRSKVELAREIVKLRSDLERTR